MDGPSALMMSQIFGKMLHECNKKHQLVREVALDVQALATAQYHLSRDGLQLTKHQQRVQNSQRILQDQLLKSFKSNTKYSTILSQTENVMQEYFDEFMRRHHIGVEVTGKPVFKM